MLSYLRAKKLQWQSLLDRKCGISYHHEPLSHQRSVRVLKLLPCTTDKLSCQLIEVNLDSPPEYEALSYVWGAKTPGHYISCDGKSIQITQNCEAALMQLRDKNQPRLLWIDSICIDQTSTEELNQQVGLMGEIYGKATTVLVWLGKGDETIRREFEHIAKVGPSYTGADMFDSLMPGYLESVGQTPKQISKEGHQISKIFGIPWFGRVWTIQEFVLSKVCKVLYEDLSMAWEPFAIMVGHLMDHLQPHDPIVKYDSCYAHCHYWTSIKALLVTGAVGDGSQFIENRNITTMMECARSHEATKAKDKVYALYGIFRAMNLTFPDPDYKKPLAEVYTEFAKAVIAQERSLDILYHVAGEIRAPELPSWVPDWTDTSQNNFCLIDKESVSMLPRVESAPAAGSMHSQYNAAKNTEVFYRFSSDGKQLYLKGQVIDRIKIRASPMPSAIQDMELESNRETADPMMVKFLQDQLTIARQIDVVREWLELETRYTSPNPMNPGSALQAFYQTLVSTNYAAGPKQSWDSFGRWIFALCFQPDDPNEIVPGQQAIEYTEAETGDAYDLHFGDPIFHNVANIRRHPEVRRFHERVAKELKDKSYFTTEKGYIGLCFKSMLAGDLVVLVAGIDMPMIMRPEGSESEGYRLIGPSYIHDIMQGEAWNDDENSLDEMLIV